MKNRLYFLVTVLALGCLSLASCSDEHDALADAMGTRATVVSFDLVMPLDGVTAPDGYENGDMYENAINVSDGDYRVYFYNSADDTYIARLEDVTVTSTDEDLNTTYTISGKVSSKLQDYPEFNVVMLANWGSYAEPAENSSIDELCNASTAVFNADTYFTNTQSAYMPFYGVHQYSNVTYDSDETKLNGALTLLRALAKVEVTLTNANGDDRDFEEVSIVHYNSQGYCAPTRVYSQSDYGQPTSWATDYVSGLHLVDNANDTENAADATTARTQAFNKETETTRETWTLYLPEYDNSGTDYSYISIRTTDGTEHKVYFADYGDEGTTDAYDDGGAGNPGDRWDIRRNNLYRYYITMTKTTEDFITLSVKVWTDKWEALFDNEYTFDVNEE